MVLHITVIGLAVLSYNTSHNVPCISWCILWLCVSHSRLLQGLRYCDNASVPLPWCREWATQGNKKIQAKEKHIIHAGILNVFHFHLCKPTSIINNIFIPLGYSWDQNSTIKDVSLSDTNTNKESFICILSTLMWLLPDGPIALFGQEYWWYYILTKSSRLVC